jgi:hypothetical protein
MKRLKLRESEGAVPVNNASGGNVAGIDNNPPKRTMGFNMFRRNKKKGCQPCQQKKVR